MSRGYDHFFDSYTRTLHSRQNRNVASQMHGPSTAALSFGEGKLAADEACDGFYYLIPSEYGMDDENIVDAYRRLWRIEESFKVTKSDLETRPVYCSTPTHIEAHFLTCYVALCVLWLLQIRTQNRYSAGTLVAQLRAMSGTNVDSNWWCFDHRTDTTDDICASVGTVLPGNSCS